jgi:hypothetical protein
MSRFYFPRPNEILNHNAISNGHHCVACVCIFIDESVLSPKRKMRNANNKWRSRNRIRLQDLLSCSGPALFGLSEKKCWLDASKEKRHPVSLIHSNVLRPPVGDGVLCCVAYYIRVCVCVCVCVFANYCAVVVGIFIRFISERITKERKRMCSCILAAGHFLRINRPLKCNGRLPYFLLVLMDDAQLMSR